MHMCTSPARTALVSIQAKVTPRFSCTGQAEASAHPGETLAWILLPENLCMSFQLQAISLYFSGGYDLLDTMGKGKANVLSSMARGHGCQDAPCPGCTPWLWLSEGRKHPLAPRMAMHSWMSQSCLTHYSLHVCHGVQGVASRVV